MVNELDVGAFYSKQTDRDLAALKALEGHSVMCFQIFITIGDQEGGCFSKGLSGYFEAHKGETVSNLSAGDVFAGVLTA